MQIVPINEDSQVGDARRKAAAVCRTNNFDPDNLARVELIVTEAAKNLIKHAGGGDMIYHFFDHGSSAGLNMLFLDQGPGMFKVAESMCNGYSGSGSSGTGLGAIRRLSSIFDIFSIPGRGTAILSIVYKNKARQKVGPGTYSSGAICLPLKGEKSGGDTWGHRSFKGRTVTLVVDGLGHGIFAADAAHQALKAFEQSLHSSPAEVLEHIHGSLIGTRGAAVAVAEVLHEDNLVRYCGVGNITGRIITPVNNEKMQSMISLNGTLGLDLHQIREFEYEWPCPGLLVMHSDGLSARWSMNDYPGLPDRHPALISAVLFRDHRRLNDDTVVVTVKEENHS